jgi:hypothetical protein
VSREVRDQKEQRKAQSQIRQVSDGKPPEAKPWPAPGSLLERIPLHSGRDLRALWKVRLVNLAMPGVETTAYVSRDMDVDTLVATESNRPAGIDHVGEAKLNRFNQK